MHYINFLSQDFSRKFKKYLNKNSPITGYGLHSKFNLKSWEGKMANFHLIFKMDENIKEKV